MRFDKEIERMLKEYPRRLESVEHLTERIAMLNSDIYQLKGYRLNADPVKGGASKEETHLINSIFERDELVKQCEKNKREIAWINKGLAALSQEELEILNILYFHKSRKRLEILCQEKGYSKTTLYRMKDKAIYKMALTLYGGIA